MQSTFSKSVLINSQSICMQFAMHLLFASYFYLQYSCSAICNPFALCIQVLLAFKLPAICNPLALCIQLLLAFKLPAIRNPFAQLHTTTTGILIAHNLKLSSDSTHKRNVSHNTAKRIPLVHKIKGTSVYVAAKLLSSLQAHRDHHLTTYSEMHLIT